MILGYQLQGAHFVEHACSSHSTVLTISNFTKVMEAAPKVQLNECRAISSYFFMNMSIPLGPAGRYNNK